jgi:hypothetical protein
MRLNVCGEDSKSYKLIGELSGGPLLWNHFH